VLVNQIGDPRRRAAVLAGWAMFAMVGLAVTADPVRGAQTVFDVARDTASGQVADALSADRYVDVRGDYAQAAALIPPGARVLAAVDVPSLLVSRTSDLNTLDLAGGTSPSPHLPYFRGTQAKLTWLRSHGYDYIVAVDPAASSCLYSSRSQTQDIAGKFGPVYEAWAPYYLDWFGFLRDVSNPLVADSDHVGSLLVVRL